MIEKVLDFVTNNRCVSLRMMDKEMFRRSLHETSIPGVDLVAVRRACVFGEFLKPHRCELTAPG